MLYTENRGKIHFLKIYKKKKEVRFQCILDHILIMHLILTMELIYM